MDTETKKLLVVDDDKFLREMYVTKFTNSGGFEAKGASSGQEALETLKAGFAPDAVLFDLIMPGMDGWEFLTEAQNKDLVPNTKMIVLSNQGSPEEIQKMDKYTIDGYIVKALKTPSEVVEIVKKICG